MHRLFFRIAKILIFCSGKKLSFASGFNSTPNGLYKATDQCAKKAFPRLRVARNVDNFCANLNKAQIQDFSVTNILC